MNNVHRVIFLCIDPLKVLMNIFMDLGFPVALIRLGFIAYIYFIIVFLSGVIKLVREEILEIFGNYYLII